MRSNGKLGKNVNAYNVVFRVPNIATFGMVMGLYRKDWNVEEAEFAFSEMRSFGITCIQNSGLEPDETTYRSMIEGWGRVGNYKRQNGTLRSSSEFIAYVKNPLADEVIKVLEDKRWNDPVFEDNLYRCLLICSCKELGHLENAVKIYTLMPKSDGRPNLHISCTMIDIYTTLGQFKEGEKLYQKLKSSGIALDVIAFSIVILKSGVVWDQELYDCLINCCARALSVNELSRLFNEMLQRGFNPNPISFNDMLHVYAKAELFNKARELFMMARKRGLRECGLRPDLCSYNTLIKAYGIAGTVEDAVCLVKEMRQNGIEPDEITSTNLIAALQQNDKYLEAVKWSLWMKQRGL
ncbi:hypothetical protein NC652_035835 [Populus alba x Populus x berolinensis]|nr:hypothetical protein NC652_035835 [Populus alba x Populus x berolinensis]